MKGNLFLSIFYFKHNVSTISWKICVRGIIPLKPKPGIALISTHQNKTSLDLVLITEKCFPLHIPNWENRKGRWKHFLLCIGEPVCTHHGGLAWLRWTWCVSHHPPLCGQGLDHLSLWLHPLGWPWHRLCKACLLKGRDEEISEWEKQRLRGNLRSSTNSARN